MRFMERVDPTLNRINVACSANEADAVADEVKQELKIMIFVLRIHDVYLRIVCAVFILRKLFIWLSKSAFPKT